MLSFPKGGLKGSASDIVKYVESERDEARGTGYYSGGGAPSAWGGEIARELGLAGRVDGKTFKSLLEGRLPDGTAFAETSTDRRMGKDLTFNAPKSVSLAALVGGDKVVLIAHDRANRRAMEWMEKEFVTARYGKGGHEVERTGQAVWASYRHEDARTANGRADPHLHTHNVLLNVTRGRDGKLRALDLDFGVDGVHLAGAIYQAELAKELRAMGYDELRKTENGFELASVSDQQIADFSSRSQQIVDELNRHGLDRATANATQKVAANLTTREDKTSLSQNDLQWEWRGRGRESGLDVDGLKGQPTQDREQVTTADALQYATSHLSERESVINGQSTRLHALRAGMLDGVTIGALNTEIQSATLSGDLHAAGAGRLVTHETLATEARVLAAITHGRDTMAPMTDAAGAAARIEAREVLNGFEFSAGQRDAVAQALTTPDQVFGIRGAAGAGKSTALAALADEARACGFRVVGTGPSQTAVDGTLDAKPDDSRTLASFVEREEKDPTPRLILMDEVGMVSSRDMDRFLQKIGPQDRVVLIGDPRQLSAVEAGSPFAQAMASGAIQYAEISEINRQKDAGLLAVAQAFADGRNKEAVALAEKYMSVAQATDSDWHRSGLEPSKDKPPQSVRAVAIALETARQYLSLSSSEREKTLMLSGTNAVRRQINEFVREGLQISGAVSPDSVTVRALDRAALTRAQIRQSSQYEDNMILRLTEDRGRARTTTDYTILDRDLTRNTLTMRSNDGTERVIKARDIDPKSVSVYTIRSLEIAQGDRVVFTENQRERGFQNNETGTVAVIDGGQIEVRKDNGETIKLDQQSSQHIDHGWAVTVHRSQGRTIDRALVAGEASRTATAQSAYVACSRERWDLRIITDKVKRLQTAWAKVAEREAAHDAIARQANATPTDLETVRSTVRTEVATAEARALADQERADREALAAQEAQERAAQRSSIREQEQEREMER